MNKISRFFIPKNACFFVFTLLLMACGGSDSEGDLPAPETPEKIDSYLRFTDTSLQVEATHSAVYVNIEWSAVEWELKANAGDIVEALSVTSGGDKTKAYQKTRVRLTHHANLTAESRTQTLTLTNKETNETSTLTVTQAAGYKAASVTLNAAEKYQPVAGFGGMLNPKIWCGSNVLSTAEIDKLYSPNQLGYSILRLMIYPNPNDWAADVPAAKAAAAHGATIFACPWDCTDALADKLNGKKHLKHENYAAYAQHLVDYIEYMRSQGVEIYAISVQNEPDMEFTFWQPNEVVTFLKEHGQTIRNTGVKLMAPEACGTQPEYTDPVLNDAAAMAQTDILAGHIYQGFIDVESGSYVKNRHDYICGLYKKLNGKTWWMTEHLFNDGEKSDNQADWQFQRWDYCLNHLGKEIHMCMEGYCSAYIYWYLKRFYGMMGDDDKRSPVAKGEIAKNGYILSHYARFASNTTRVAAETPQSKLLTTAYINADGTELTVVMLNMQNQALNVTLNPGSDVEVTEAVATTETANMQPATIVDNGNAAQPGVLVEPWSITSVRMTLK
ncbi:MAG: hypothetical protein J6A40_01255 [Bacteroides sp.]|nr:hypothetical protein [Bacteroides sp.]